MHNFVRYSNYFSDCNARGRHSGEIFDYTGKGENDFRVTRREIRRNLPVASSNFNIPSDKEIKVMSMGLCTYLPFLVRSRCNVASVQTIRHYQGTGRRE